MSSVQETYNTWKETYKRDLLYTKRDLYKRPKRNVAQLPKAAQVRQMRPICKKETCKRSLLYIEGDL